MLCCSIVLFRDAVGKSEVREEGKVKGTKVVGEVVEVEGKGKVVETVWCGTAGERLTW